MRRFLRYLLILVGLLVASGVGAVALYRRALSTPFDPNAASKEVAIAKGANPNQVARLLEAEKLIKDARLMRLWCRFKQRCVGLKAGRHRVSAAMTLPELVKVLSENPIPDEISITLVEGWRLGDTDAFLADRGLIARGAYLAAASTPSRYSVPFPLEGSDLAGYLYPETYRVPEGPLDVDKLIQRQLDAFVDKFWKPHQAEIQGGQRPLRDIVIMASLLEREEPKPEVRPQVAGVLYKRLDAKTPLGVDATSRFTLVDWNDRKAFLAKLRDPNDPYNTRTKAGLPPGPIGAPSLPSLLAALRPVPSQYWYYLHDAQQNIHFGRDAAEHEANRKKYNVW